MQVPQISKAVAQTCPVSKGVLKKFAKFTGKHLCQSLDFNKVAGLSLQLYLKKTLAQVFSYEFFKISEKTFAYRTPPEAAFEILKLKNL